jgi:hypothetical protein
MTDKHLWETSICSLPQPRSAEHHPAGATRSWCQKDPAGHNGRYRQLNRRRHRHKTRQVTSPPTCAGTLRPALKQEG